MDTGRTPNLARMKRPPTHPGEVFEEEFRKPSGITQAAAARRMRITMNRLNEVVKGKRSVSAETAVLIGALTGTNPQMWLHMQADYDLWYVMQDTDTSTIHSHQMNRKDAPCLIRADIICLPDQLPMIRVIGTPTLDLLKPSLHWLERKTKEYLDRTEARMSQEWKNADVSTDEDNRCQIHGDNAEGDCWPCHVAGVVADPESCEPTETEE